MRLDECHVAWMAAAVFDEFEVAHRCEYTFISAMLRIRGRRWVGVLSSGRSTGLDLNMDREKTM